MGKRARGKAASSGEGSGAGFALLILLGVIIKFFWWIVGALALVAAFFAVRAVIRYLDRRRAEYQAHCAEVCARADQQHNWVLQGDDRGVYGPEGARLMREVTARRGGG